MILLIDADSKIPNLALMKLAAYHKSKGDTVELVRLNMPYYPNRKKVDHNIDTSWYDKVYCSVIFEGNLQHIHGDGIVFGGTGSDDITLKLSDDIEDMQPDYSIYPECDYAIGFITRGCIRNCVFCKVPSKEGYLHQVSTVDHIATRNKVRFLDNNILAYGQHEKILEQCVKLGVRVSFNEGLDIRLINDKNSYLLSRLNYVTNYIFAFDDIKDKTMIEKKLELLQWRKDWQLKFYVYVNPSMPLSDTIERIKFLKERKLLPYIMRDISCWQSEHAAFYTDLAAWCNQAGLLKKLTFEQFLDKRHKNQARIDKSKMKWRENK